MILMAGCVQGGGQHRPEIERLLARLDSTIGRKADIEASRRLSIQRAKAACRRAQDGRERYDALVTLYDQYDGFRLDSALEVADDALRIARGAGDTDEVRRASIRVAQAHLNAGEYVQAIAILDTILVDGIDDQVRERLYSAFFGSYHGLSTTALTARERGITERRAGAYRDSVTALLSPGGIGHTWLTASRLYDSGRVEQAIAMLENGNARLRSNAAAQYGMGMMYYDNNQRDSALCALARASILDLDNGKKEYMSLVSLARLLYEEGDISRAFNYIKCALEDAVFSHASIRTSETAHLMPFIESAYRANEYEVMARKQRYLVISLTLGVLLMLALVVVYLQLRRLSATRRSLVIANDRLARRSHNLALADAEKLHQVNTLLQLHAANVAGLKEYRRTLYNMMKSGQYSRVCDRLKSDSLDNSELRMFYDKFDATFLSIFPDFIEEVNRYMKESVAGPQPDRLTPELRIMALMKLGVESTGEISMMLQYTPQTVYNYRSSIRNMLACPLDEFAAAIRVVTEG